MLHFQRRHLPAAFLLLLFAAAIYFPLFLHLDHLSLRLWDEARRAVNAYEMLHNGNLLVTHYGGQPEMWGTKPPMLIWFQAFWMWVLGPCEVAVRLPSALAALGTVGLLVLFCWKVLQRPMAGFLAGLVLVCTKGYVIHGHVARSGDFDSLLIFWETGYLLAFFTFLIQTDVAKQRKWLYLTATGIALAGLTKGVAGFFFVPGLAVFYLLSSLRKNGPLPPAAFLRWRHTWLAALVALGPVVAFYLLRNAANPGYIATVMQTEWGGRYLVAQRMHEHEWWHYLRELWEMQYRHWLPFVPLGLAVGLAQPGRVRRFTALLLVHAVCFLTVVSLGQTRIVWYMAPVYPTLALLVGIGFERLLSGAAEMLGLSSNGRLWLAAVFVFAMFYHPYRQIMERVYFEKHPERDLHELRYRDFMHRVRGVRNYTVVHKFYNSHVAFYANVYNEKGYHVRHQALRDFEFKEHHFGNGTLHFAPGDTLLICEKDVQQQLDSVYAYKPLHSWETCGLVVVVEKVQD